MGVVTSDQSREWAHGANVAMWMSARAKTGRLWMSARAKTGKH